MRKIKADSATLQVSPPWEAYYHTEKKKYFFVHTKLKLSTYNHPDTKEAKREVEKALSEGVVQPKVKKEKKEDVGSDEKMEIEYLKIKKVKEKKQKPSPYTTTKPVKPAKSRPADTSAPSCSNSTAQTSFRPFPIVKYNGCAIFDTCSIMERPTILEEAAARNVLCVIPLTVIYEIDGLKKNSENHTAQDINKRFRCLLEHNNPYIRFENSEERAMQIPGYRPAPYVADDWILKTAFQTKTELLERKELNQLNIKNEDIRFITEDQVLSMKADVEGMRVLKVEDFYQSIKRLPMTIASNLKYTETGNSQESLRNLLARKNVLPDSRREKRDAVEWFRSIASEQAAKEGPRHSPQVPRQSSSQASRPRMPIEDDDDESLQNPQDVDPEEYMEVD